MIIKKNVITGFNRGAKTYDQVASLQAQIAKELAKKIHGQDVERVLEIGCGTGLFSQYLVQAFPNAELYLTDIAEGMVDQCQQRFGQQPQIQYLCRDGEALTDLPAFDLITSSMTLHWFQQITDSLQTITRQLKQNGRFLFAMLTAKSLHQWREMCIKLNVPFATPSFPEAATLANELSQFNWQIDEITVRYDNLQNFLSTLKLLGAIAPRENYEQLSPRQLRNMMRLYDSQIEMTYEVAYGEYRAP